MHACSATSGCFLISVQLSSEVFLLITDGEDKREQREEAGADNRTIH
jgi:hypothetical protein